MCPQTRNRRCSTSYRSEQIHRWRARGLRSYLLTVTRCFAPSGRDTFSSISSGKSFLCGWFLGFCPTLRCRRGPDLLSCFRCRFLRRWRYTASVIVGEYLKYFVNLFLGLRTKMLAHTPAKIVPFLSFSESFLYRLFHKTYATQYEIVTMRIIRRIAPILCIRQL